MSLDGKTWFLHEVGGEESVDRLHCPGIRLDVSVGESDFYGVISLLGIHVVLCSSLKVTTHSNNFADHLEY